MAVNPKCVESDISSRQNEPSMLRLLKARQWRWRVAERWQKTQILIVIFAPFLSITVGMEYPDVRPAISLIAVILTVLDTVWIDRVYKDSLKTAAKASELLDTNLFKIEWNNLVAGKQPTPEETEHACQAWERNGKIASLKDWYAPEVDRAPLPLSRAICQRTNITYDTDLRKIYKTALVVAVGLIILFLVFVGLYHHRLLSDLMINALVPSSPFIIWALRERFRQVDAIAIYSTLQAESERLIVDIKKGVHDASQSSALARELQNAIFLSRARTVLLFPGIYRLRRHKSEQKMIAAARFWTDGNNS